MEAKYTNFSDFGKNQIASKISGFLLRDWRNIMVLNNPQIVTIINLLQFRKTICLNLQDIAINLVLL
jgi:hypothetical protein